jgi:DNA-directed RNA polymerase sigma subunit (sigma70/sigma32)
VPRGDQRQGVSKLDKLSSPERRVLEARVLTDKPMTVEELAEEFGVCCARVKQLEALVREKMAAEINQRNSQT